MTLQIHDVSNWSKVPGSEKCTLYCAEDGDRGHQNVDWCYSWKQTFFSWKLFLQLSLFECISTSSSIDLPFFPLSQTLWRQSTWTNCSTSSGSRFYGKTHRGSFRLPTRKETWAWTSWPIGSTLQTMGGWSSNQLFKIGHIFKGDRSNIRALKVEIFWTRQSVCNWYLLHYFPTFHRYYFHTWVWAVKNGTETSCARIP